MAEQRTEQPTQRRLEKAHKEGNFPASKEFVSSVQLLVFVALVVAFSGAWFDGTLRATRGMLRHAFGNLTSTGPLTPAALVALVRTAILPEIVPLLVGGAALVLAVLAAGAVAVVPQFIAMRNQTLAERVVQDVQMIMDAARRKRVAGNGRHRGGAFLILLAIESRSMSHG